MLIFQVLYTQSLRAVVTLALSLVLHCTENIMNLKSLSTLWDMLALLYDIWDHQTEGKNICHCGKANYEEPVFKTLLDIGIQPPNYIVENLNGH